MNRAVGKADAELPGDVRQARVRAAETVSPGKSRRVIKPTSLICNHGKAVYVIAEGVCNHRVSGVCHQVRYRKGAGLAL